MIALKGIYLSEWLYQDIGLRQFSDIDLLVKEEDGLKCLTILKSLGFISRKSIPVSEFVEANSDFVHYSPMELNDISVEIHIKLHKSDEKYLLDLDKIWQNACDVQVNGYLVKSLELYDLIIHLCIHLDKHFKEGHVQFTSFNDIVNLLSKFADTLDWNTFIAHCKTYNCEYPVFKYLVLVNRFYNSALPLHIIEKYNSQLTDKDELLFLNYLHGHDFKQLSNSAIPEHLSSLRLLKKKSDIAKYLIDIIFPPKAFMIQKYGLQKAASSKQQAVSSK